MILDYLNALNATLEYIESDLKAELDKNFINHNIGVSYETISRIFSILTGITLNKYIRMRRLSEAAKEISYSNKKIYDIALDYGYESAESFYFAFKQYHEVSPSDVRNGSHYKSFLPMSVKLNISGGDNISVNIETIPGFSLSTYKLGSMTELLESDRDAIAEWKDFTAKLDKEIDSNNINLYELIYADENNDIMYYAACEELDSEINEALGLKIIDVPSARYAIFTVKRGDDDMPLVNTLKYIMGTFFQDESRPLYRSPEFVFYKPGDREDKDYEIKIYITIDD